MKIRRSGRTIAVRATEHGVEVSVDNEVVAEVQIEATPVVVVPPRPRYRRDPVTETAGAYC